MVATAQKMTRRLQLSGLYGFDFILEAATGYAYLIEMNPRATQVGHLALGPGHDLPAALYAAITGDEIRATPRITDKDTIALFPQEWLKNPVSEFLHSAYHDVPWEEPEFVSTCLERRKSKTLGTPSKNGFKRLPRFGELNPDRSPATTVSLRSF